MIDRKGNGANLYFENKLWEIADKMHGRMDAIEYKHVALALILLKYISVVFQAKYDELAAKTETEYTEPEVRYGNVRINSKEIRSLTCTRDTLLPKLISSELCVSDTEKLLEGVV